MKKTEVLSRIMEEHTKAKPGSEGSKASVQYLPYLYNVAKTAQASGELFPQVLNMPLSVLSMSNFNLNSISIPVGLLCTLLFLSPIHRA